VVDESANGAKANLTDGRCTSAFRGKADSFCSSWFFGFDPNLMIYLPIVARLVDAAMSKIKQTGYTLPTSLCAEGAERLRAPPHVDRETGQ